MQLEWTRYALPSGASPRKAASTRKGSHHLTSPAVEGLCRKAAGGTRRRTLQSTGPFLAVSRRVRLAGRRVRRRPAGGLHSGCGTTGSSRESRRLALKAISGTILRMESSLRVCHSYRPCSQRCALMPDSGRPEVQGYTPLNPNRTVDVVRCFVGDKMLDSNTDMPWSGPITLGGGLG